MTKRALITGVTGQDGSYLAELLLSKGYEVHGIKRRASSFNTSRIDHLPELKLHYGDMTDGASMRRIIDSVAPTEIYNLAAQSHVQVSFETPEYTANADALGAMRLLECLEKDVGFKGTRVYQASTSELYGNSLIAHPGRAEFLDEATPFEPRSPYGVAKLYAYWITVNYREAYGVHASNGILFNHESLTSDTPVIYRRNGLIDIKPIRELVTHRDDPSKGKKYQTVPDGLEVWDGTNWSVVTCASATWRARDAANIVEVNCRGAYYRATGDHVSFTDGDIETKTSSLTAGQALALKVLPEIPVRTAVSLEEAELLGMLVADGYLSDNDGDRTGRGVFTKNDDALRERVAALWRSVTGGYVSDALGVSGFDKAKKVKKIVLNGNSGIIRYWRDEMYTETKHKRVPARILNASPQVRETFLNAYNACDGLKGGKDVNQDIKSFTTNSSVLAQGLYLLCTQQGYRVTLHSETRDGSLYYHLNVNVKGATKGQHLVKPLNEIKAVGSVPYEGWVFDLATESGTFSAGVGLGWVHNSPRRGPTFVTRKITQAVAAIHQGRADHFKLGNLDAQRDWGHARDYVEAMWLALQRDKPDDYVIATGVSHSVREFVEEAFSYIGHPIKWRGVGVEEVGYSGLTGRALVSIDPKYFRPAEVDLLRGDAKKARTVLGWKPKIGFEELVCEMVREDLKAGKASFDA